MKKLSKTTVVFLIEKEGNYLFQKRKEANIYGSYYVLPAGHVEEGETVLSAVVRELKEELNITVLPENLSFKMVECLDNIVTFFFEVKSYLGIIQNNEPDKHTDVCFLPATDAKVHPMVQKEILAVKNGQHFMETDAKEVTSLVKRKSARAILISKENKLVLIKRVKAGRLYYVTPGGGVEEQETPAQALIRELKEETGSDVFSIKYLFHYDDDELPNSVDFFLCYEASRDKPTGSEWTKYNTPNNQYEIVEVSLEEAMALDIKPSALKEELLTYFKESI